jgi:hypothetical protein
VFADDDPSTPTTITFLVFMTRASLCSPTLRAGEDLRASTTPSVGR